MNSKQVSYAASRVKAVAQKLRDKVELKYPEDSTWEEDNDDDTLVEAFEKGELKLADTLTLAKVFRKGHYDRNLDDFFDKAGLKRMQVAQDARAKAANAVREKALDKVNSLEQSILDELVLGEALDVLDRIKEFEELAKTI